MTTTGQWPRITIVHDYLTQRGGAERVVLAMLRTFPGSRLLTSFYDPARTFDEFRYHRVETLWTNRSQRLRADPRRALPLLAPAFSAARIDADLVIASSSGWAHGVSTDAPVLVYCHNPPRWLHQTEDYLADHGPKTRLALTGLRTPLLAWDRWAARRAARYLANSSPVRDRIRRAYGRDAHVVHPPVSLDTAGAQEPIGGIDPGFLLTVARPRGYKNTAAICRAMPQLPGHRLVVVGGLPEGIRPSAQLVGVRDISDAQLRWLYAHARCLIAASHEDFGLTPLEANAFGVPVLALRSGGYLDTVVEGVSGLFFDTADPTQIAAAVRRLADHPLPAAPIREHVERFGMDRFAVELGHHVGAALRDAPFGGGVPVTRRPVRTESRQPQADAASAG